MESAEKNQAILGQAEGSMALRNDGVLSRADRAAQRRAAFLSGSKFDISEEDSFETNFAGNHPDALRSERYTELPINALSRQTLIFSDSESVKDPSAGLRILPRCKFPIPMMFPKHSLVRANQ